MGMARRPLGNGALQLRASVSPDPLMDLRAIRFSSRAERRQTVATVSSTDSTPMIWSSSCRRPPRRT